MDAERTWRAIEQERLSLAELLDTLSDEEWNAASLCDGWRVKDVAAHIALAPQPLSPGRLVVEGIRAGGRFHNANHDISARYAESGADLVAQIRDHAASRRLAKVTTYRNTLFDILVHGQDIAISLGRERQMARDAAAAGAERVWTMGWPFWAKRRYKGLRFVATDLDWAAGSGLVVAGPIDAVLLMLTGRSVALPRLSGPGHDELVRRVT